MTDSNSNKASFQLQFPEKARLRDFSEAELLALEGKLSPPVIEFLRATGRAIRGDLFWTVLPQDYHAILSDWGLPGEECWTFMRTSFGSLLFQHGDDFYALSPFLGEKENFSSSFDLLLDGFLLAPLFQEALLWRHFLPRTAHLPPLAEDEVYALQPPVEKGGDPETSPFIVQKLSQLHQELAAIYDHQLIDEESEDDDEDDFDSDEEDDFEESEDDDENDFDSDEEDDEDEPNEESLDLLRAPCFLNGQAVHRNFKFALIATLNQQQERYIDEAAQIRRGRLYSRAYRLAQPHSYVDAVVEHYKNLEIPQEILATITRFEPFGTEACYNLLLKEWDGQGDDFFIPSLVGIEQLSALEHFAPEHLLTDDCDLSPLLACPTLRSVQIDRLPQNEANSRILEQLKDRGVTLLDASE